MAKVILTFEDVTLPDGNSGIEARKTFENKDDDVITPAMEHGIILYEMSDLVLKKAEEISQRESLVILAKETVGRDC